ncbi:MAG TPA: ferritin-like domain-containing protein [Candidatus Binatia bacterium]|nr:ferritin-like domain-containing protein [Candidatus Binatia bacterium]
MSKYTPNVEIGLDRMREMARGNYDLRWMSANPAGWGHKAEPGPLGIRLEDVETGHYAAIPEHGSPHGSMAPRGCEVPAETTSLGMYTLNELSEVWSENAAHLYDEAVVRQWNSVTDVPWHKLRELPDDIERAVCQMCTGLTEVEFVAGDMPAKWLCRINHDFHEVKLFLATQIMDEARHLDVFRKRALANGGGLLMASPGQEKLLATILEAPDYTTASALMHIFGEGFVLTLFRQGEFLAPTEVEKEIFRLCMQDEARHVAYGVKHLKYFLERHPDRAEQIHAILDLGEQAIFALTLEPQTSEPRAILAGGGLANIDVGMARMAFIYSKQVREYLRRLQIAGLDRESRLTIPKEIPFEDLAA